MPWRLGAWWPQQPEPAPHLGYARVTSRGHSKTLPDGRFSGTMTGFTVQGGREIGNFDYIGSRAIITIEDWDFGRADITVGQPIAIRWDTGDDPLSIAEDARRWPKGPPCIFAGFVVSFDPTFTTGFDGVPRSVMRIVADDWLGSWPFHTRWLHTDAAALQDDATDWLLKTVGIRNRVEMALLGAVTENVAIDNTDINDFTSYKIGKAIQRMTDTTGTEVWVRHGERIGEHAGQGPPPEDGTYEAADGVMHERADAWFIRAPQMVLRKLGGPTTFNADLWRISDDTQTTDGTAFGRSTSAAAVVGTGNNGAPIPTRHSISRRPNQVKVHYPPPLDRATLRGKDWNPQHPNLRIGTDSNVIVALERTVLERGGLFTGETAAFDAQLQANAALLLAENGNDRKVYTIVMRHLSDDETTEWAGIGLGDEVAIHPLDLDHTTTTFTDCQVRYIRWDNASLTGNTLTLQVVPVTEALRPVAPVTQTAIWTAQITWGHDDDSDSSGYERGLGIMDYGDITSRGIDIDGDGADDVEIDAFVRLDDSRVRINVGTEEEYDLLQGKFLQITNVASFPLWVEVPDSDDNIGETIAIIPPSEIPAENQLVGVALWETLPTGAMLSPQLTPMPGEIGSLRDTAVASLQAAGFTVVVTTEEDDANIDRVISSDPAPGVLVRPGSEVSISVGVAVPVEMVAVPDVSNLLEAAARTAIENAGLVVNFIDDDQTSGIDNQVLSQSPQAGVEVAVGSTVNVTIRNVVAAPPQKLRDMVLTWHQSAHEDPRQGFSRMPPDAGPYGSLVPNTVTVGEIVVRILRLAERGLTGQDPPDPNEGRVLITTENHDQINALAGNWIRMEPTGVPTEDVIFQIPEPENDDDDEVHTAAGVFPADRVPADGTQIAVSIWDQQPVGQPRTEPYPTAGTTTTVPDLTGQTETNARLGITNLGLVVAGVRDENQTSGTDDRVIRTEPAAGQPIAVGGSVLIVLRNRVDVMVQVPDLTGLLQGAARTAVEDAGLMPVFTHTTQNTGIDDEVISQSPAAGTTVAQGSTVTVEIRNLVPEKQWSGTLQLDSSGSWHGHPYGDSSLTEHDDDLGIVISRLDMNRTAGAGSNGAVRIWCETAAQVNAIEGKWMRIETTNEHSGDIIFQIAESATTRISNDFDLTDIATPLDDTRVAVSIWSSDPTGLARTANLPTVLVPDVYEETDAAARTAITAANLTPGTTTDEDETESEAGGGRRPGDPHVACARRPGAVRGDGEHRAAQRRRRPGDPRWRSLT